MRRFVAAFVCLVSVVSHGNEIDFQRDIRPILSNACFHCHGPDESSREADLRLDQKGTAEAVLGQDAASSELVRRIRSDDPDEVMPPPDSAKSLSMPQIELLARWVDAGADWPEHWAFVSPEKAGVPDSVGNDPWLVKPFDGFVLEKLRSANLAPSPEANRFTLIRRLTFDITGLPPSWEEVESFVTDDRPDAYERLVDRLLASKHFGERMAMDWLDAARYADTDGYQADSTRTNWPWRDWVVNAFNENMPFDQFTIEQFAGDLIPNASPDQILATCFHRNHMTNGEGGRDPEESRVDYVIDRVNTMGTVWLGLTLGCTQCHSHKYDPISHAEYYQLNAFFNSIDEDGKAGGGAKPFYEYKSDNLKATLEAGLADSEAWLKKIESQREAVESAALGEFDNWISQQQKRISKQTPFSSWHRPTVQSIRTTHGGKLAQGDDGELVASGVNARHEDYQIDIRPPLARITGMRLTVLPNNENGKLASSDDGHFILTNMKLNVATDESSQVREIEVSSAVADYEKEKTGRSYGPIKTVLDDDPRSGWTSMGTDPTQQRVAVFGFEKPITLNNREYVALEFRHRSLKGHANMRRFIVEFTDEVGPTLQALQQTPLEQLAEGGPFSELEADVQAGLRSQFLAGQPEVLRARAARDRAKSRLNTYTDTDKTVRVMVLAERKEMRDTHVLERGVWDKKGASVDRGVPAALPPLRMNDTKPRPNRLDLARWIVAPDNPLTARVYVNRIWQMMFGRGLVRTPEDFGLQGESPTHPRLLDWLAVEFMDSGWNVKHLIKQIAMSAAYRQSSDISPDLLSSDPQNRLLARNGRFRLPSWMIRDAALRSSGQLAARMGGPPVYPFQPPGAWSDATMGRFHYQPSVGSDRYRRSLYTFWRRSVAPTGMFDASKRRNCEVRSVRTNTPLHALTLLNDETYVEATRALAINAMNMHEEPTERIDEMFRAVLSRNIEDIELEVLLEQLEHVHTEFENAPRSASELLNVGQANVPQHFDAVELATYATIASTIMNLDEAITRE